MDAPYVWLWKLVMIHAPNWVQDWLPGRRNVRAQRKASPDWMWPPAASVSSTWRLGHVIDEAPWLISGLRLANLVLTAARVWQEMKELHGAWLPANVWCVMTRYALCVCVARHVTICCMSCLIVWCVRTRDCVSAPICILFMCVLMCQDILDILVCTSMLHVLTVGWCVTIGGIPCH